MIGIGVIPDVKTKCLVCDYHRQWLIVNVTNNAPFCHFHNHISTFLVSTTQQMGEIQMSTTSEILTIVLQNGYRQIFQCIIIYTYDMFTTFQHSLIALQLSKSNSSHDIRHIALVPKTIIIVLNLYIYSCETIPK